MGVTTDYFVGKKPWSFLKDALLEHYLVPYLTKLAKTGKDIYIIDCFAGQGRFDDGNKGSPIIIAEAIKNTRKWHGNISVKAVFIEKKYATQLRENLDGYPFCEVIDGLFEDNFQRFREICKTANVFLYVDPYGITSLDSLFFKQLAQISRTRRTSIELLLNLNTFGFLREGCRLIKPKLLELKEFEDPYSSYEGEFESVERMNKIAGGCFWEPLIVKFYDKEIDFRRLESQFTHFYLHHFCEKIAFDGFSHVLHTPIKAKSDLIPKYRMIFGTNYIDGVLLMAENMNKRWAKFLKDDAGGQMQLFHIPLTTEGQRYSELDLDRKIMRLAGSNEGTCIKRVLAGVWEKFGIAVSRQEIEKRLRELYSRGEIEIAWDPPTTKTRRRPRSLSYNKYNITITKTGQSYRTLLHW